jgi:hypothetical protein
MTTINKPALAVYVALLVSAVFAGCGPRGETGRTSEAVPRAAGSVKAASGYAAVNGLNICYEIHGAGDRKNPPLVLLHGGGSTIGTSFGTVLPSMTIVKRSDWQVSMIEAFLDAPMSKPH